MGDFWDREVQEEAKVHNQGFKKLVDLNVRVPRIVVGVVAWKSVTVAGNQNHG